MTVNPLMTRERVVIPPRKPPTKAEKIKAWNDANGICELCGKPVPPAGEGVEYDHREMRGITGDDSADNLRPVHPACHGEKTAKHDAPRMAKTKRQEKLTQAKDKSKRSRLRPPPGTRYDWSRGRYVRD